MNINIDDVGEIYDSSKHTYIEWKIPNYFSYCQRADTCLESRRFYFSNTEWFFSIYPNGKRCDMSVEFVGLYLNKSVNLVEFQSPIPNNVPDVSVNYTIGIKSNNGDRIYQGKALHQFKTSGFSRFIRRADLYRERFNVTSRGVLTIFFVATTARMNDVASQTASLYCFDALSRNFKRLYDTQQKSDITFQVDGLQFPAHKLILGTRSSVFAAMFEHNMRENSSGIVNIEDCDPDTFNDFLLFIYTGKIEDLSSKNISQLFMLSDKYDISDLREMLVDFMKENLCLEIVCQVAIVADKFGKYDLRESAKEMITKNIKTLLPTEQWITFMRENPVLATEFLMTVMI